MAVGWAGEQASADPPHRLAERPTTSPAKPQSLLKSDPNEHPLMPALRWAYQGLPQIEKIKDYSATLVKRERVGGKLGEYEHIFLKIRHQPFSVYMYFLGPEDRRGQEVIYVHNRNDNMIIAHGTGVQRTMFGTVSLKPTGPVAMKGQRYPITEIGILNMVRRLIEVGEKDLQYGECEVKFFEGAKINDRTCTCIQVVHPVPRRNFLFHVARIFVDDELNLPIRYESYDWPKQPGGEPELIEEYTYLNLKLNNGFTDLDFDPKNPNYNFP
jgi:outer membrane lipoprotein-sorting protein